MTHAQWQVRTLLVAALAISIAVAGCAKQPTSALTTAAAPAPSGGVSSSPVDLGSQVTVPAKLDEPAGSDSFAAGPTPWGTRPSPSEFSASPALKDIFFGFDRYDISPASAKVLDESAAWLKDNGRLLILIEGHTDERGTNEYNLSLGERRAKATMNYLASRGVQAPRVGVISYGEERPQCREKNETCWSKNRRARFMVKSQ